MQNALHCYRFSGGFGTRSAPSDYVRKVSVAPREMPPEPYQPVPRVLDVPRRPRSDGGCWYHLVPASKSPGKGGTAFVRIFRGGIDIVLCFFDQMDPV